MPRAAAALLVACLLLAGCGGAPEPPEQQVRAVLAAAEASAEARDAGAVLDHVSEAYGDAEGRDRHAIRGLISYLMLRHPQIHLWTRVQEVEILGPARARARLLAAMAGHPIGGPEALAELRADVYRFDLTLALEDEDWRVVEAEWTPARSADWL